MTKYQLWSRDEYGQGSILFTSEDLDEVIKRAKQEVTTINVQNALTVDDREKNWEAYMVMIGSTQKDRKHKRYVYAGSTARDAGKVYGVMTSPLRWSGYILGTSLLLVEKKSIGMQKMPGEILLSRLLILI